MAEFRKIIQILISSPGDVDEFRKQIPFILMRWSARRRDVLLMPVMWESHSAPAMGSEPQAILNKSLIPDTDLLIAIFWSRLGTQTNRYESGTVEEIEEFYQQRSPQRAMVYFLTRPVPTSPTRLDLKELERLQRFKEESRKKGLYHEFSSIEGLEADLHRHLDYKVHELRQDEFGLQIDDLSLHPTIKPDFVECRISGTIRDLPEGHSLWPSSGWDDKYWVASRATVAGKTWQANIWLKKGVRTRLALLVAGPDGTKFFERNHELSTKLREHKENLPLSSGCFTSDVCVALEKQIDDTSQETSATPGKNDAGRLAKCMPCPVIRSCLCCQHDRGGDPDIALHHRKTSGYSGSYGDALPVARRLLSPATPCRRDC